jgi:hypothetical protein
MSGKEIKKPINNVIIKLNELQNDVKELKKINKEMIEKLEKYFIDDEKINNEYIEVEKKSWFF